MNKFEQVHMVGGSLCGLKEGGGSPCGKELCLSFLVF